MSQFNPPKVWCSGSIDDVTGFPIDHHLLSPDIFSAFSGPDSGVQAIDQLNTVEEEKSISSIEWTCTNRKAHGITISLYDRHPITGKVSGDPIADCFAYTARKNNALLVVADGVNWGEKSRLAAQCAVHAAINYLHRKIFVDNQTIHTTKDVLKLMRAAFDIAHISILEHDGGLTTLNITMVLPMNDCAEYAVCSVNVGDSLTYVFSKRYGMNELSVGSHDINQERDMRDAGGALGPVNGTSPLLVNLTYSQTTCEPGDIVFLTTDGISDNFDPVVTKIAVPGRRNSVLSSVDKKAEMLPHERHLFSMKAMEVVIHEHELITEQDISAEELCTALTDHVITLTKPKRMVIENPELYNRKYKVKERKQIEEKIKVQLKSMPGKLDHATIVAYEAGIYRGESSVNEGYYNNNNCNNNSLCSGSSHSSISSNPESVNSTVFESNV